MTCRVLPLEIWDATVHGATLFAQRAAPSFFESLAEVAARLDCADVALCGGGVDVVRAREAFAARGLDVAWVSDDPFFAADAALAYADVVVDAGQTSLKAIGPLGRKRLPRAADDSLTAFTASIATAVASVGGGARVIVALPCTIDAGHLGDSSYPTRGPVSAFIAALGREAEVVNDAVLAARAVPPPARGRRLVLTVGHGVGAAMVER